MKLNKVNILKGVFYSKNNTPINVLLEIPKNPFIGLSDRDSICYTCGMIFYFPSLISTITMVNTSIPLDIVFLDQDFKVLSIIEKEPYSGQIESTGMYVVELNKGFCRENSIEEGCKLFLNKNCMNYLNIKPGIYKTNSGISIKIRGDRGLSKYIDVLSDVEDRKDFNRLKKEKDSFNLKDIDSDLSEKYKNVDIEFRKGGSIVSIDPANPKKGFNHPGIRFVGFGKEEEREFKPKNYKHRYKLKKGGALYLLDEKGKPQMKMFTEERIFSRIDTRKLLDLVKKVDEDKSNESLMKLGKKIVETIHKQDTQPVQYVEE